MSRAVAGAGAGAGLIGGVRKALIVDASESDFGTCRRCFLAAGVELVGRFAEAEDGGQCVWINRKRKDG